MAVYMEKSKLLVPSMDQYPAVSISTTEGEPDWSESIWSLGSGSMDHEHSDRSNVEESKQANIGSPPLINEPKEENLSSPSQIVRIRKKPASTRSPMRASHKEMSYEERSLNTFGPRPQLISSRSSDSYPDEKMQRPFFGLDCYELIRRNSMPVRLKTRPNMQELSSRARRDQRPESWQHSMRVSSPMNRARLKDLRTSLSADQPAQTSPDVWRTKPPRPPTQGTESVPVGRVADIVNRVESLLLQSEDSERVPASGSPSTVRSDIGGRNGVQQSVSGQRTAIARHNSDTLVNKRQLLVDKAREQPSESASYLIPVYEIPQMSVNAGFRKLSTSNEPPMVTDHRRRGTPSATSMQLRQEQAPPSSEQGGRREDCRRQVSDAQSYKPFFARMGSSQAEQIRNRRSSDTKVTRAHISPQISTRASFDNSSAKSAELEKKTVTKTGHDGERSRQQQPRILVSEEGPLRTPNSRETDDYSTSTTGWLPVSNSAFFEDPQFPTLPSLSSVLSADSQATVTSFAPPPTQLASSNCMHVSHSPSRRITRALTLPAVSRQRTPSPPPRLVDNSTSISDSLELNSSSSHAQTSISLFELLHFCRLEAVVINVNLVEARRGPVWWADDPITCLGLRVTTVPLHLPPESGNLKVIAPAYHASPAGAVHTITTHPDSAFKPVTPRHNSGQSCVLLIEEVYQGSPATAVPELQAGQILVELNGVSLLSTANTDRLRLLRSTLLSAFRALDVGSCRGLALTVATPSKPVSRSDRGDLVVNNITEQSVMLSNVAEISIQSQPPPVPPRRRQQGQEEYNNPELEVSVRNSANTSLRRVNSSSSCSTCSSNQDRVLFGRSCR